MEGFQAGSGADGRTDHELVRSVAAGDRAALAALVRRHQDRVLSLAYRMLGRWDAAEDAAQEAFLRVWGSAGSYKPDARFTTWLYRILSNLCLDQRRRWRRERRLVESPHDLTEPVRERGGTERRELQQRVQAAIQELPERQRLALILHRYEGLNHAEIAEITGWRAGAVESCLVRAYAGLRQRLGGLRDR